MRRRAASAPLSARVSEWRERGWRGICIAVKREAEKEECGEVGVDCEDLLPRPDGEVETAETRDDVMAEPERA
jgi:hypothetical protein